MYYGGDVNGVRDSVSAHVNIKPPCVMDDSVLNNRVIKKKMLTLWDSSGPDQPIEQQRERAFYIYLDTVQHKLLTIDNTNIGDRCSIKVRPFPTPPSNSKVVGWFHLHPGMPQLETLHPENCSIVSDTNSWSSKGPSGGDIAVSILERTSAYILDLDSMMIWSWDRTQPNTVPKVDYYMRNSLIGCTLF
jgi:hypothetical protein